eukprot:13601486-Heterocapsa_arctica.AAC.1
MFLPTVHATATATTTSTSTAATTTTISTTTTSSTTTTTTTTTTSIALLADWPPTGPLPVGLGRRVGRQAARQPGNGPKTTTTI